ncbi:MAG: 2-iminoacetate synthase ThiH [Opitutales bacterium]
MPIAPFSAYFPDIPVDAHVAAMGQVRPHQVEAVLDRGGPRNLDELVCLLSPAADRYLEEMARLARDTTVKHFGRAIRLFAPIYLSNECVNICAYCGFSRNNPIPRITIPVEQAVRETQMLADQGFRSLLIVAGEHPKYVSNGYVEAVIRETLKIMPSLAIELGPMKTPGYVPLVEAGCEALTVYQETYHRPTYKDLHPSGPKRRFNFRLDTAERGYEAGFRRLGIGALLGLHDWRYETVALAAHVRHLLRKCWKSQISVAFPRLRPATGDFQTDPANCIGDRELVRVMCAFRLMFPHIGMVLSTRESPAFRDNVLPLGVTMMSAGSSTEPGGYSSYDVDNWTPSGHEQDGEQFHIADERPPREVAAAIRARGYEAVWKDFDTAFVAASPTQRQPALA